MGLRWLGLRPGVRGAGTGGLKGGGVSVAPFGWVDAVAAVGRWKVGVFGNNKKNSIAVGVSRGGSRRPGLWPGGRGAGAGGGKGEGAGAVSSVRPGGVRGAGGRVVTHREGCAGAYRVCMNW